VIGVQTLQEPLSNASPRPVPDAHWRTLIRATSGPMHARLMIAPKQGGGICYAFRWGINGGGSTGCYRPRLSPGGSRRRGCCVRSPTDLSGKVGLVIP
jgi:hypothetical protein